MWVSKVDTHKVHTHQRCFFASTHPRFAEECLSVSHNPGCTRRTCGASTSKKTETQNPEGCTQHFRVHTLDPTPHTLHPASHTPHPTPDNQAAPEGLAETAPPKNEQVPQGSLPRRATDPQPSVFSTLYPERESASAREREQTQRERERRERERERERESKFLNCPCPGVTPILNHWYCRPSTER